MQKHKSPFKRYVLLVVVLYLIYAVSTAVIPAMLRKPISEEFAASVSAADFYGQELCVDRSALVEMYLIYAVSTAVIPAMLRKPISEEFAASVSAADFYGQELCVDRSALVETPAEGLDTRLHILDEAAERIDVSYYAIHMGQTTDLFLGALLDAAERGVQVRILVDAQFGGLTQSNSSYAAALGAHPNVELKIYNPVRVLKPWTWNGRLHDKYILIDNRLLLLGGRNIGDKYFAPESFEKELSLDRDVLIYNTVWGQPNTDSVLFRVREYMDEIWGGADTRLVFSEDTKKGMEKRQALLASWGQPNTDSVLFRVREYMDEIWGGADTRLVFSEDTKKGMEKRQALLASYKQFRSDNAAHFDHTRDDYEAWTYPANRVSFVHNDAHIGIKEPKAGYTLGQLLLQAGKSVTLQSPYVILDPMLKDQLTQLGEKQIDARILTNSVGSSPNPIACAAYYGDRNSILNSGVSIWEYQGENSIHAKSYVIDDRITAIGSYNLDPRSAYLDTELLIVIDSPEFTAHFQQVQDTYFQQALRLFGYGTADCH